MPEVLETNEEIKNAIIGVGTGIILMLCGKLPSISEVLGTSEKISNVLRDKHSREYWWAEIIVVLVSWNPVFFLCGYSCG